MAQATFSLCLHFPHLPPSLSFVPLGAGFHYKCNNFKPAFCNTTTTTATQMHNKYTKAWRLTQAQTRSHIRWRWLTQTDAETNTVSMAEPETERERLSELWESELMVSLWSSPLSVWLSCCVVVVVVCCSRGCWRSVFASASAAATAAAALSHVQSWQHAHTPLRTHRHRQWL